MTTTLFIRERLKFFKVPINMMKGTGLDENCGQSANVVLLFTSAQLQMQKHHKIKLN